MPLVYRRRRKPLPSADAIAGNEDLLMEILIRLPAKSLCRFKCISKGWYSLISHPHFTLVRIPKSMSGLFYSVLHFDTRTSIYRKQYKYLHLSEKRITRRAPFKYLSFGDDDLRIMHSCNGLLVCSHTPNRNEWCKVNFYVCNPTTKQFVNIPHPPPSFVGLSTVDPSMNLAFDLARAPYYKIVLVDYHPKFGYQIQIYSSETRTWRLSGNTFRSKLGLKNGVFCNGTIHWISKYNTDLEETLLRFDVDRGCLETMLMPPIQGDRKDWEIRYFGESGGHLYVIGPVSYKAFDVLEMESDYSNWFFKYRVDLDDIPTFLKCPPFTQYSILHLLPGEVEEESCLVLHVRAMVISYNLKDKSVKKLCDLEQCGDWSHAHQYIENLFRI